jgi:hypothetical protein
MLTQSLISHLSSRLLKALKNEYVDDSKFTASLMSIYKKLIDFEITRSSLSRTSETIEDLVKFCNKHLSLRSSSNDRVTLKKYQHEKISSARTPNFQRLGRIPEESPRLSRPLRKSVKKVNKKEKIHAYYESMIGQYLKMTLKSPVKTKPGQSISRSQASQVQLKDGMFFRLY